MHLYLFLVLYAVTLFLMCVVLVPRSWDGVSSLKEYFLDRRVVFYSLFLFATLIDVGDSYLKGGFDYLADIIGPVAWVGTILGILISLIGMKTANIKFHNVASVFLMLWQYLVGFEAVPMLGV